MKNINSPENSNKNKDWITWFFEERAEVFLSSALRSSGRGVISLLLSNTLMVAR